jgi:hypothetical protein
MGDKMDRAHRQPALARARTAFVALFVVWHFGAMLAVGAPEPIHGFFWPVVEWYAEGLRMANRFGMFSRPPKKVVLVVVGVRRDRSELELATSASGDRSFWGRIVDARLRKVQDRLLDEGARRLWGDSYLRWFCRSSKDQGITRVRLEVRDAGVPRRLFSRSCASLMAPTGRGAGSPRGAM